MNRKSPSALATLGLSAAQERVYRKLLETPSAHARELAAVLALEDSTLLAVLGQLEVNGLIVRSPQTPPRYMAIAPDVALGALAQKRRAELDQALGIIPELQAQAMKHGGKQERLVELLTSREAERLVFESLHATAREEVVTLVRLPILISELDEVADVDQATQREAQQRGVRYRSVVDAEYLDSPGAVARVRAESEAGEEIRVVPNLPIKLVIADRRIAFVPLGLENTYSPSLVVRASALVDALYALYELLWETASPVHFEKDSLQVVPAQTQVEADMTEILALLAAGLNDKQICYELHISPSTLQRRISALMKRHGARTRFQLGWQAARKLK